jgi:hypothetical protein
MVDTLLCVYQYCALQFLYCLCTLLLTPCLPFSPPHPHLPTHTLTTPRVCRYLASVVRERNVFEELIRSKGVMVLPVAPRLPSGAAAPPPRRLTAGREDNPLLLGPAANSLTRRAGGRAAARPMHTRVIVDVREFMSSLPAVLHQQVRACE